MVHSTAQKRLPRTASGTPTGKAFAISPPAVIPRKENAWRRPPVRRCSIEPAEATLARPGQPSQPVRAEVERGQLIEAERDVAEPHALVAVGEKRQRLRIRRQGVRDA